MANRSLVSPNGQGRGIVRVLFAGCVLLLLPSSLGAQSYIGRFDVYGGFGYLYSPRINLSERGFHLQVGTRPKTWFSFGFDYATYSGHTSFGFSVLSTALQQQLGAQIQALVARGFLPAGYVFSVPVDSETQSFAMGPQLAIRRWQAVSLYIRPGIGVVHETATPHAADAFTSAVVAMLAPGGKKEDWTPFYGFGGSADINFTKHFSLRLSADFVHDHLFSDLLKESRNTLRLAIGPAWQFGPNVRK